MGGRVSLSRRQREVLDLTANDKGGRTVAGELGIGLRTVKRHKREVKNRLGLGLGATTQVMLDRARQRGVIK